MQWFTHKSVAAAGALAMQASPPALLAVLVGSVLPDILDTALSGGNKKIWRRIHRQSSHWFGWYLLLILLGAGVSFTGLTDLYPALFEATESEMIFWLGIGGMTHILLDALTPMRVPLYPFGGTQRFGIKLVSTGTWKEHVFLLCALGLIALNFEQARIVLDQALHYI